MGMNLHARDLTHGGGVIVLLLARHMTEENGFSGKTLPEPIIILP